MALLRFSRLHARTAAEILVAALAAYAVASYSIAASFQIGRLAMPADFDDVVYLGNGQQWLNEISRHGFLGNLLGLINQHAPVQTAIAALSYLVAGPYDWPPYAANGVLLAVSLFGAMRILERETGSLLITIFVTLCLTAVPFFQHAVTEFRPDLFAGLVTAFAALLLLQQPLYRLSAAAQLRLGLLLGLALLMKPAAFLASGFIHAVAVLFSCAAFLLEEKAQLRAELNAILKSFGLLLLGAMLVFGPYLLLQGREIFDYIYLALFTLADVNNYNGTWLQQASFYANGPGGGAALGPWFWIGLFAMALRLAAALWTSSSRLPTLCAAYLVLFVIYLVLTLTAVKQYFLGSMFYAFFSLLMARDGAWLVQHAKIDVDEIRFPYGAVILALIVVIQRVFVPSALLVTAYPDENLRRAVRDTTQQVWQLAKDKAEAAQAPITLLSNTANPVRGAAIGLQASRERLDVRIADGLYAKSAEEFLSLAENADIVVVSGPVGDFYPGSRLGNEFQSAMQADKKFRSLPPMLDGFVQIYEKNAEAPAASLKR